MCKKLNPDWISLQDYLFAFLSACLLSRIRRDEYISIFCFSIWFSSRIDLSLSNAVIPTTESLNPYTKPSTIALKSLMSKTKAKELILFCCQKKNCKSNWVTSLYRFPVWWLPLSSGSKRRRTIERLQRDLINETHFVLHTLFDDALWHKIQGIDACAFAEETKIVYSLVPKISKPLGADVNYI